MEELDGPEKLNVFICNLDKDEIYEGLFDSIYPDLIESLTAKYNRYLADDDRQPIAILLPDPAVLLRKHSTVLNRIKRYVEAGGFAIFAGCFSSFVRPNDLNKFWKRTWGLDWKVGSYHRTDVFLNRSISHLPTSAAPQQYSQKALNLTNVARSDSVYITTSESSTQSMVFAPEPAGEEQVPVAMTQIGDGWVGYIGDVNNEKGSQAVILAMLELAATS